MRTNEEITRFILEKIHLEPRSRLEAESHYVADNECPGLVFVRRGFRLSFREPIISFDSKERGSILASIGRAGSRLEKKISERFLNFIGEDFLISSLDYSTSDVEIRYSPRIQFVSTVSPFIPGLNVLTYRFFDVNDLLSNPLIEWNYNCVCIVNGD
ncbi:MAG: hypothetical protein PHF70_02470 [Opitutales bacterium]|nr:hypothetical protein [Opitutales bacterium]